MIVMPSSNIGFECGRLFGRFPKQLGHLMHSSPGTKHRVKPKPGQIWALDNWAFSAFKSGKAWSEEPFYSYLEEYSHLNPLWAVVPDCVGDKHKTLELWQKHSPAVAAYGVPLAFAVQDGMTPKDVPKEPTPAVIFVGGTTSWKWKNLTTWTQSFARVHVGRVNSYRLLWICNKAGAESCDGTGWFKHPDRTNELERYLEEAEQGNPPQLQLI